MQPWGIGQKRHAARIHMPCSIMAFVVQVYLSEAEDINMRIMTFKWPIIEIHTLWIRNSIHWKRAGARLVERLRWREIMRIVCGFVYANMPDKLKWQCRALLAGMRVCWSAADSRMLGSCFAVASWRALKCALHVRGSIRGTPLILCAILRTA